MHEVVAPHHSQSNAVLTVPDRDDIPTSMNTNSRTLAR
jgi:hypothetical protein